MQKLVYFILLLFSHPLQAQNVGIGTMAPLARLHIVDSNVLFSATGDIPLTPGGTPIIGAGRRMMWYPDKAAFRAGYVSGSQWNPGNIGKYSFAAGYNAIASGEYSTSFHANALGEFSFATGGAQADGPGSTAITGSWASGELSTALGIQSIASGYASATLGYESIASGGYAVALGFHPTASGDYSIATGLFTNSMGQGSYTAGSHTISKSAYCFTIGHLNDTTDQLSETWSLTDRLFQVGNGINNAGRKNAVTVLRNGRTGIGTVSPLARLHVSDSSVLFTANGDIPVSPAGIAISGEGRRMIWYSDKAAFRAGYVYGGRWNKDSIGNYSIALGLDTKAGGDVSLALGYYTTASGYVATAMGIATTATGFASMATGTSTSASGDYSTAMGNTTVASSNSSTAMGSSSVASGEYSTAMGFTTTASGGSSTATGAVTQATVFVSTAMGGSTIASGDYSTAMGVITRAKAAGSLSIGAYNDVSDDPNPTVPSVSDRIFQIGNGTYLVNSNAITVLRNGNTGVGMIDPAFRLDVGARMRIRSTPGLSAGLWLNNDANTISPAFIGMRTDDQVGFYGQTGTFGWRFYVNTTDGNAWLQGTLTQASDARLKKNISPLRHSLQRILQLNGYHYYWKDESNPQLQTGLLAQEVQQLFPGLVSSGNNGLLAVNYTGLIPVMIESIKEQQTQIDELKKMVEKLLLQNGRTHSRK